MQNFSDKLHFPECFSAATEDHSSTQINVKICKKNSGSSRKVKVKRKVKVLFFFFLPLLVTAFKLQCILGF